MSITSVKGIVATGLAALALLACGAGDNPGGDGSTSGAAGAGGSGGNPNHPGEGYQWPAAWVFKCYDIQEDFTIYGKLDVQAGWKEWYEPSEVTMKVGQILAFEPHDIVQNMESGTFPDGDGKFSTLQGARRCLIFDVPGTYPFFIKGAFSPAVGTLYVTE